MHLVLHIEAVMLRMHVRIGDGHAELLRMLLGVLRCALALCVESLFRPGRLACGQHLALGALQLLLRLGECSGVLGGGGSGLRLVLLRTRSRHDAPHSPTSTFRPQPSRPLQLDASPAARPQPAARRRGGASARGTRGAMRKNHDTWLHADWPRSKGQPHPPASPSAGVRETSAPARQCDPGSVRPSLVLSGCAHRAQKSPVLLRKIAVSASNMCRLQATVGLLASQYERAATFGAEALDS